MKLATYWPNPIYWPNSVDIGETGRCIDQYGVWWVDRNRAPVFSLPCLPAPRAMVCTFPFCVHRFIRWVLSSLSPSPSTGNSVDSFVTSLGLHCHSIHPLAASHSVLLLPRGYANRYRLSIIKNINDCTRDQIGAAIVVERFPFVYRRVPVLDYFLMAMTL